MLSGGARMRTEHGSRTVTLYLLGGFQVSVDHQWIPLLSGSQRLLALLALTAKPLPRSWVSAALWPDVTAGKAGASLRSMLWRTQRLCGPAIEASGHDLRLAPWVIVDVRTAEEHAHRLLGQREDCDDILTAETRARLSTELLPGWYDDDWVVIEREHHHQLRLHALEAMCIRLTAAGRYGEAVESGLAAVCAEPLQESAHAALVRTYLAAGNRYAAIRQYHRCRGVLDRELGLEPSEALELLLQAALSGVLPVRASDNSKHTVRGHRPHLNVLASAASAHVATPQDDVGSSVEWFVE
jgi:DNA-binding SARP family transcriptional activator